MYVPKPLKHFFNIFLKGEKLSAKNYSERVDITNLW